MVEKSIILEIVNEDLNGFPDFTDEFQKLVEDAATFCYRMVMKDSGYNVGEVSLTLTDDNQMRAINLEHRGIDAATDILSFPMCTFSPYLAVHRLESEPDEDAAFEPEPNEDADIEINPETGNLILGDLILSLPRAQAQAEEFGHSIRRELAFLTVHGMLHLLGYDHELGEKQEREMFALQDELMMQLRL